MTVAAKIATSVFVNASNRRLATSGKAFTNKSTPRWVPRESPTAPPRKRSKRSSSGLALQTREAAPQVHIGKLPERASQEPSQLKL